MNTVLIAALVSAACSLGVCMLHAEYAPREANTAPDLASASEGINTREEAPDPAARPAPTREAIPPATHANTSRGVAPTLVLPEGDQRLPADAATIDDIVRRLETVEEALRATRQARDPAVQIAQALKAARLAPPALRQRKTVDLAVTASKSKLYDLQEALLREAAALEGADPALAMESLYQVGWARAAGGNADKTRTGWLEVASALPMTHPRRAYARHRAAAAAVRLGRREDARRELDSLVADLERRTGEDSATKHLLPQSRALLEGLQE